MCGPTSVLKVLCAALIVALLGTVALADIRLPAVFSDHMVLQAGQTIPVWGWAQPGERVTVTLAKQSRTVEAGDDGRWMVRLRKLRPGGPYTLTVSSSATNQPPIAISDVLMGEVWLCSGQSNMDFPVSMSTNSAEEIARADLPQIRMFKMPYEPGLEPRDDAKGAWIVASPKSIPGLSAVGFFFARELHRALDVPVGMLQATWGGTRAEAWTSREGLADLEGFGPAAAEVDNIKTDLPRLEKAAEAGRAAWDAANKELIAAIRDEELARRMTDPNLNTTGWPKMNLPKPWEEAGLPNFDGLVWFRRTVEVPAAWAGRDLMLKLGPVDEIDTTWFNGSRVGGLGSVSPLDVGFWNMPREYPVPGNLVKPGTNVITLSVADTRGAGGLWGQGAEALRLELAGAGRQDALPLAGAWQYKTGIQLPPQPPPVVSPNVPTVLFNGLIHPLIPYGLRGAIWYQGESNATEAYRYGLLLAGMIRDWRQRWGEGAFPFGIVQLANFQARVNDPNKPSDWAELREAQSVTAQSVPDVGLAMAIDIGDAKDIHPTNKQDVGRRLARWALAKTYGKRNEYSGPIYDGMKIRNGKIRIAFRHARGGLMTKDGAALKGFAIAGADKKFFWADAAIDGDRVVVSSVRVPAPASVRYGWANNPLCNLYNVEGLPASPFRTDDWPLSAAPAKPQPGLL